MPSTLAVSGRASTAVVGLFLVRSVLERVGEGVVETVHKPSFRFGEIPLNPCPYHLPVLKQEIEPVRLRINRPLIGCGRHHMDTPFSSQPTFRNLMHLHGDNMSGHLALRPDA